MIKADKIDFRSYAYVKVNDIHIDILDLCMFLSFHARFVIYDYLLTKSVQELKLCFARATDELFNDPEFKYERSGITWIHDVHDLKPLT